MVYGRTKCRLSSLRHVDDPTTAARNGLDVDNRLMLELLYDSHSIHLETPWPLKSLLCRKITSNLIEFSTVKSRVLAVK